MAPGVGAPPAAGAAADQEVADELLDALRFRVAATREHAWLRARQGDEARRRGAAHAVFLLAESDACAARARSLARELAALERSWAAPAQVRRP